MGLCKIQLYTRINNRILKFSPQHLLISGSQTQQFQPNFHLTVDPIGLLTHIYSISRNLMWVTEPTFETHLGHLLILQDLFLSDAVLILV